MIIRPYSDKANVQTPGDFPALKLFIPGGANSGTGNNFHDWVSGQDFASGGTLDRTSAANAIRANAVLAPALPAAIPIGASKVMLLIVANQSGIASNGVASGAISTLFACGSAQVSYGTNTAALGATPTGAITGMAAGFDGTHGLQYLANLTTWTAPAGVAPTPSPITSLPTMDKLSIARITGNNDIYGIGLFVFATAIPANWPAAQQWMTAAWANGDYRIYPGLNGAI